ncbi:hypothetical protein T484DRAFT_1762550 [Baffinella frigidus]|nr:hypothetical protein T484DRAFT_1762550 [Cryptophyta sp. CCMP2293]
MVKTQNRTALAVLTSTLAVTCLMAIVVYHAEVPSALLQTSQLVAQVSPYAQRMARSADSKLRQTQKVISRPSCPPSASWHQ